MKFYQPEQYVSQQSYTNFQSVLCMNIEQFNILCGSP